MQKRSPILAVLAYMPCALFLGFMGAYSLYLVLVRQEDLQRMLRNREEFNWTLFR